MKKFELIYIDLENKIKTKKFEANTLLPSENRLKEYYGVSRETIRKVLSQLEENGYIQKKHGLGSIILEHNRFSLPISGLISYKELQNINHFVAKTHVLKNQVIDIPKFLNFQEFNINKDEKFIHLIRKREIDGKVMIVDEDFIRQSIVSYIPNEVAEDSIYQYFEEKLNLSISYAYKEIKAEHPNEIVKKALNLDSQDYVINVKSYVYLEDTTFFQFTISHHQLDKFEFSDFARRKNKLG